MEQGKMPKINCSTETAKKACDSTVWWLRHLLERLLPELIRNSILEPFATNTGAFIGTGPLVLSFGFHGWVKHKKQRLVSEMLTPPHYQEKAKTPVVFARHSSRTLQGSLLPR